MIARALAVQVFQKKHLVVVPNCTWTGDELDLLVVTPNLRVIDVEVKISRADLKADARKDKWYHYYDWQKDGEYTAFKRADRRKREWPRHVWKHYYALPAEIWKPEMAASLPSSSGVILLERDTSESGVYAYIERRSMPCRDAKAITAEDAINIARLASIRMWDAYVELHKLQTRGGDDHDGKEHEEEARAQEADGREDADEAEDVLATGDPDSKGVMPIINPQHSPETSDGLVT